ncbi:phosphotransferase family protein [Mycolicibacterium sp. P1-18]|uniref:phosphotransferase family protein n=1 Tax=Mycolicibacterium sp. P1-18 TaxID=2024615 RepID=UPI00156449CF|nr:aminoglycoside phosphotransferase family protein [Mycolicibacterium sp. P1-18]
MRATSLPRRNRNIVVRIGDSDGYVLKKSEPAVLGGTGATLRREAEFYRQLANHPPLKLSALVPGFLAYDPERATLVLKLLPHHETLAAHSGNVTAENFPISAWRAVGAALAAIHQPTVTAALEASSNLMMPSIFYVHRPTVDILQTIGPAGMTVLRIVQQSEPIREALDHAPTAWRTNAFIHGDIRAENLMYQAPSDIRVIDWELCGLGDPAWDVASTVADLVLFWLRERARAGDGDGSANVPGNWVVFQAAIRAMWMGYESSAPGEELNPESVSRLSAIRMVQSAFEGSSTGVSPAPTAVLLLQIAENVLTNPAAAARQLFALPPSRRLDR